MAATTGVPRLRIGIVSWNTAALLDACLGSLPAALDGIDASVVVVDNASADQSVDVALRHSVAVIDNPENVGYARAMNQALLAEVDDARAAELLLALNPDTVPAPGSLRRLVERLDGDDRIGIAVPRLVGMEGRHQHSAYRFPHPLIPIVAAMSTRRLRRSRVGRALLLEGSGPHRAGPVDWAIGAVHLIRRGALDDEPPYSERSFMYAEDLDLCWRLAQRGHVTELVADSVVAHVGNAAGAQAFGDERSVTYWRASYDTIRARRSRNAARAMGAGCAAATLISLARSSPRWVRDRGGRRLAGVRGRELRVHLAAAVTGGRAREPDVQSSTRR